VPQASERRWQLVGDGKHSPHSMRRPLVQGHNCRPYRSVTSRVRRHAGRPACRNADSGGTRATRSCVPRRPPPPQGGACTDERCGPTPPQLGAPTSGRALARELRQDLQPAGPRAAAVRGRRGR
jgi:hypothetical protein